MANDSAAPSGIKNLKGREPIACALTLSIKGANGAPTQKDRLHIMEATPGQKEYARSGGGTYKAPARDPHASFAAFNNLAHPSLLNFPDDMPQAERDKRRAQHAAELAKRRVIPARLAHVNLDDLFEYRLQCAKVEPYQDRNRQRHDTWTNTQGQTVRAIPSHPKKGPVCIGNGERAQRWDGQKYVEIPCLGEKCEYSVAGPPDWQNKPSKAPCGPWMRFIARFDWQPFARKLSDGTETIVRLPNLPFKLTSGGWNTVKEFVGFFDSFKKTCGGFGVDYRDVPLFGMPVLITLSERMNMEASPPSRFPVASIAMAGDADMVAWIGAQLENRAHLQTLAARAPLPALTDREQQAAEVLAADFEVIAPPSVPAGR